MNIKPIMTSYPYNKPASTTISGSSTEPTPTGATGSSGPVNQTYNGAIVNASINTDGYGAGTISYNNSNSGVSLDMNTDGSGNGNVSYNNTSQGTQGTAISTTNGSEQSINVSGSRTYDDYLPLKFNININANTETGNYTGTGTNNIGGQMTLSGNTETGGSATATQGYIPNTGVTTMNAQWDGNGNTSIVKNNPKWGTSVAGTSVTDTSVTAYGGVSFPPLVPGSPFRIPAISGQITIEPSSQTFVASSSMLGFGNSTFGIVNGQPVNDTIWTT